MRRNMWQFWCHIPLVVPSHPGEISVDNRAPILSITSDQASTMFAASLVMSLQLRLRVIWFPDTNHQEANIEKNVMVASGLKQLSEKAVFVKRLPHGPERSAGHWRGQLQSVFEARSLAHD